MNFRQKVLALYEVIADSFKIGDIYDYDTVVNSAKKFGNPDILSGCAFTAHCPSKQTKFKLERIPLSKLRTRAGKGKYETPDVVMFAESGPEYDEETGELEGGDEYWAQKFAKEYSKGDTAGPIIVMPDGSHFDILDGRHRARAAFLRGEKDIRAFVAQLDSVPRKVG